MMASLSSSFVFQAIAALIAALLSLIGNAIAWHIPVLDALPGIFIIYAIALAGIAIKQALDKIGVLKQIPAFAWIMLVGLIVSIPGVPGADLVVKYTNNVAFLATCTPILAYAGIAASKDLPRLKQVSWKLAILSLFVWIGAFLGAAIIAQILIALLGL
jgi:hypothetical protein